MNQIYGTSLRNKISPTYRKVLIISEIISLIIGAVVVAIITTLVSYFDWSHWITIVSFVLMGIGVIYSLIEMLFLSKFTVRNWQYSVDEEYVRLKNGRFFLTYQIIPMTKIQFVETSQGPILRKYHLYELSIGTMGSEHAIPGLTEEIALQLREEISQFAKVKEVE